MQVKDLTTDELKALIRETVLEAIEELLPDPDAGLTVKPEFEQSLLAIRDRREKRSRQGHFDNAEEYLEKAIALRQSDSVKGIDGCH